MCVFTYFHNTNIFVVTFQTDAPLKTAVRPYKRPTPQEVCFQRMQLAQQQAAQLSASVKAASQSSTSSFAGEKKRIAHRPNPQITSTKTSRKPPGSGWKFVLGSIISQMWMFVPAGPAHGKPAASETPQGVKSQTTVGILSKTSSTVAQKRTAHTPTMKVIFNYSCQALFDKLTDVFLFLHSAGNL